ncbi:heme-binding protein 2 isoform X3 [Pipistrellus kuhlii]|uniref:heme-binding protein 2 isoform X3 n=1 Tax=Pipistrellus kuhlii TaxID=59472 RepID=UPI00174EEA2F|nr:heme-binding protein 2 isoform X3 [Pipistrellus kuhlii]
MAEEQEPGPGAAEGAEAPAVETPGWQVPEDSGAQPESYEIRHYGPAKWVCTSVESRDWDSAIQTGFTRLTSYIQGKNEKEMKMKMTAPVVSYVEPGSGPFSESTITVSLYVPSEQQPDPPRPSESDVFIEDRAAMTVFVRNLCLCFLTSHVHLKPPPSAVAHTLSMELLLPPSPVYLHLLRNSPFPRFSAAFAC